MAEQRNARPKVGVITFTDGRDSFFDLPRENFLRQRHTELVELLAANGCAVSDPMRTLIDPTPANISR